MYALHVKVKKANHLKNKEISGKSDPYVIVDFQGVKQKTKVIEDELDPIWNETVTVDLKGKPLVPSDKILLRVMDFDKVTPDKFLGQVIIPLQAVLSTSDEVPICVALQNKKGQDSTSTIEVSLRYQTPPKAPGALASNEIEQTTGDDERGDAGGGAGGAGGGGGPGGGGGDAGLDASQLADGDAGVKRKKRLGFTGGLAVRPQYSTKKQDFQIRVKVVEARQLQGANISPICKVTCWKESKDTRVRSCTNSPFWDQIFFFNYFNSAAELLDQQLVFTVYDSRRLRRDSLIGSFKFDLSLVYESERHSMINKWLLLCNPEDPMSGARGYLKISVVILEPGDEAPSMKVTEADEKEDIEGNLLRPAGVQLRPAIFKILLYMAEDLPRMDSDAFKGIKNLISKSDEEKEFVDPYAMVSFAGKSIKSSTKYGTDHPEWNEEITMNIQFPSMCEKLKFTFYDWDRIGYDDPIGTGIISISQISAFRDDTSGFLPTFGPSFVNLYGSPREYSDLPDKYEALNLGKGQGVAYRGRVLLELSTELLDEPTADVVKPLEPDTIARIQKSLRRRKYQLYVAFLSATMIEEKRDGPIEFEVSIGNHGNKLDESVTPCASTTPPTNPVSDGLHYYYLPWSEDKPCTMVDSQWEDISFRLGAVNLLLRIADHLAKGINHITLAIKANLPIETQAQLAISSLDEFIMDCNRGLPQWEPENIPQNDMDIHLRKLREDQLNALREQALNTRETVSEIEDALKELKSYRDSILKLAVEPQMSIPDIIIWMLCGGKRIAYHRIPAHEVLYHTNEDYRGMECGIPQTINLKKPVLLKDENKVEWKIPAQIRAVIWFGLEKDRAAWTESHAESKLQVVAETYENQASIVGSWVTKRPPLTRPAWSDNTGRIELTKESIQLPSGWEWIGDWYVSPEVSLLYKKDAGKTSFVEELFYNESRTPTSPWKASEPPYTDAQGEPKCEPNYVELPAGWTWGDEWKIDFNRPCDEDGFEYTIEATTGGYVASEKLYHMFRRRRLIRTRILGEIGVPVKQEVLRQVIAHEQEARLSLLRSLSSEPAESWEYAFNFDSKFHTKERKMDMVRRRRWHRALAPIESSTETTMCLLQIRNNSKQAESSLKLKKKENLTVPRVFMRFRTSHIWHLRAYIFQARSILAADNSGLSDAYVRCSFQGYSQETQIIQQSLCPTWDETLIYEQIDMCGDPKSIEYSPPPVILELFDYDQLSSDHFLGRLQITPVVRLDPETSWRNILQWYTIEKQGKKAGDILAAFELILLDGKTPPPPPTRRGTLFNVPEGIRPVLQRTGIEILCWGVRSMRKYKLSSVNSPSVEFEIGGKVVESTIIKSVKKNPNFSLPLLFLDVLLPKEEIYLPPMNICVRDHRAFGQKPIVGVHVLTDFQEFKVLPRTSQTDILMDIQTLTDSSPLTQEPSLTDPSVVIHSPSKAKQKKKYMDLKQIDDKVDWWSKFYASVGEWDKCLKYKEFGYDTICVYPHPLEDVEGYQGFTDFCNTFTLTRGKNVDADEDNYAGEFKGTFRIYALPEDPKEQLPLRYFEKLSVSSEPEECVLRVYVIRAIDLQPADASGLADPYVEIAVGQHKVNSKDKYIPNTLNPEFGKMFQLKCLLPIEKDLHVIIKDYDAVGADDIIGQTYIDLENRRLTKYRATCGLPQSYCISGPNQWRDSKLPSEILLAVCDSYALPAPQYEEPTEIKPSPSCRVGQRVFVLEDFERGMVPNPHLGPPKERLALHILNKLPLVKEHVETRMLYSPLQPNIEQGKLQMWVDIFPTVLGDPGPPFDISPRQPNEYVLRLVVWNTFDVVLDEKSITGERMSDIYVKGWIAGLDDRQKTDVHYRSLNGEGNFNWRFVFPFFYLPAENNIVIKRKEHFWSMDVTEQRVRPQLVLQIWDNDLFSPDDFLGTLELNLSNLPSPAKSRSKCALNMLQSVGNETKMVNLFECKRLNGFWPFINEESGTPLLTGKIEMEMELVTKGEAELRPAGKAREDPNENPHLEPPKRPETSFLWFTSPWKTFKFIIWKKMKWILIGLLIAVILGLLVVLFIYALPPLLARKMVGV
uniref:C2 domain-containing protein n=1 Tax=Trichobilharzia regenti TaxID=157069 RepID=A0AA85KNN9_TRIRE|nr:unnamed protein product [Trichobilharzia regenti]